eukprot:1592682-Pyramimonas_sp.AAC.1
MSCAASGKRGTAEKERPPGGLVGGWSPPTKPPPPPPPPPGMTKFKSPEEKTMMQEVNNLSRPMLHQTWRSFPT